MPKRKHSKMTRRSVPGIRVVPTTMLLPRTEPDSLIQYFWIHPFEDRPGPNGVRETEYHRTCESQCCEPESPRHTETISKQSKTRVLRAKRDCIDLRYPETGYVERSESIDESYEDVPAAGSWTDESMRRAAEVEEVQKAKDMEENRRRVGKCERICMMAEYRGVSPQQQV